jgi:hypothetical protein
MKKKRYKHSKKSVMMWDEDLGKYTQVVICFWSKDAAWITKEMNRRYEEEQEWKADDGMKKVRIKK